MTSPIPGALWRVFESRFCSPSAPLPGARVALFAAIGKGGFRLTVDLRDCTGTPADVAALRPQVAELYGTVPSLVSVTVDDPQAGRFCEVEVNPDGSA